jgi:hypothetical protein
MTREYKDLQQYHVVVAELKKNKEIMDSFDENKLEFHELRHGTIKLLQDSHYFVQLVDVKKRLYNVSSPYYCETCGGYDHVNYHRHKCYTEEYF